MQLLVIFSAFLFVFHTSSTTSEWFFTFKFSFLYVCLLLSSIVCPPFPLLLPVFPFFPFVVSISPSLPVPGDGHLTPGIRSQWMHGSPANAALAALQLASRAVPSLVPVALSPKGNSHQRQWAAYQGKQQSPPCQLATKAQTEKREEVQI